MPKHYKEMMDEIINKIDEDAPTNAVAHGGVDMAPNAKHPLTKSHNKYKKDNEKDTEELMRRTIMKKFGAKIKENNDNNNVVLKGVLNTLDKLDEKIDKLSGVIREEIKIEEPEVKKSIREKSKV
tara:strand:- start:4394 stop:4768 length:375 start_codon:yes stop_codon:yes gene_type:complete